MTRCAFVLSVLAMLVAPATPQSAPPTVADAWSDLVVWRGTDGSYPHPIHATLMPDGRVVFIGHARDTYDPDTLTTDIRFVFAMTPTPLGAPLPAEAVVAADAVPLDVMDAAFGTAFVSDTLICAGHTLTSDGKLFVAGGTRMYADSATGEWAAVGLSYATQFDGAAWSRVAADMTGTGFTGQSWRWYGTCTRLHDGRILVSGGYDFVLPTSLPNVTAEIFNPTTGAWSLVSPLGATPYEIWNPCYTHAWQLPTPVAGADVLAMGQAAVPCLMTTAGAWQVRSASGRPGTLPGQMPNICESGTMLPIRLANGAWGYANGSVMIVGGLDGTSHAHHVDVYDPVADTWRPRLDAGTHRHDPATVVLPDGRVLILNGYNDGGNEGVGRAQYVDPANGFALADGASVMPEVRGYHNLAILLPDGRVLVGGGNDDGNAGKEKANFRYYYPSYMFGARPTLWYAPETVAYGGGFFVGASAASEAVLIGLPSMTHSFDMNGRAVQIPVYWTGSGYALLGGPADARTAPPGYYMLFVLDANRVPSVAKIVRVM